MSPHGRRAAAPPGQRTHMVWWYVLPIAGATLSALGRRPQQIWVAAFAPHSAPTPSAPREACDPGFFDAHGLITS